MTTISPRPLAKDILAALGAGYNQSEIFRREDDPPSPHLRIATPEGAEFTINTPGYGHPDHFRIHGEYPISKRVGIFYPNNAPIIQVSTNKSGLQIAKDIKRRFLPDFLCAWEGAQARARASEEAHTAKLKTYHDLCMILGEQPKDANFFHNGEFNIYRHTLGHGSVNVRIQSADSIRFEVSTDLSQGQEIAKSLALLRAKSLRPARSEPDSAFIAGPGGSAGREIDQ